MGEGQPIGEEGRDFVSSSGGDGAMRHEGQANSVEAAPSAESTRQKLTELNRIADLINDEDNLFDSEPIRQLIESGDLTGAEANMSEVTEHLVGLISFRRKELDQAEAGIKALSEYRS